MHAISVCQGGMKSVLDDGLMVRCLVHVFVCLRGVNYNWMIWSAAQAILAGLGSVFTEAKISDWSSCIWRYFFLFRLCD